MEPLLPPGGPGASRWPFALVCGSTAVLVAAVLLLDAAPAALWQSGPAASSSRPVTRIVHPTWAALPNTHRWATQPSLSHGGRPVVSTRAEANDDPDSSQSPSSRAGALLALLGALLGVAVAQRSRARQSVLRPMLMASSGGYAAMVTPEQALQLWTSGDYVLLDVRSDIETSEGTVRSPTKVAITIPMFDARTRYNPAAFRTEVEVEALPEWLDEVKARVPPNAKVIVMCEDGGTRTAQAVHLLARHGYPSVVGLQGGFRLWDQRYDRKLRPRTAAPQYFDARGPVEWGDWAAAVGLAAAPTPTPATARPATPQPPWEQDGDDSTATTFAPNGDAVEAEEAKAMWELEGYTLLDVRSDLELKDGRIRSPNRGAVELPLFQARTVYDSALGQKVVEATPNKQWLEQARTRFPPDAKLVVLCSDGVQRTAQAVALLRAAGYRSVTALRGGYSAWDQAFDRQLAARPAAAQAARAWRADPVDWGVWGGQPEGSPAPAASGAATDAPLAPPDAAPPASAPPVSPPPTLSSPPEDSPKVTLPSFQDPAFRRATLQKFAAGPGSAEAEVDEARVLWEAGGYSLLDVRSDMETSEGRIRGGNRDAVELPLFQARSTWDATLGRRVVQVTPSPRWLEQVRTRFPPDAKLVVLCSDGVQRTAQAVALLRAAGYRSVTALRGGYSAWDRAFDRQLAARPAAAQAARAWRADPVDWGVWGGQPQAGAAATVATPSPVAPPAAPTPTAPSPFPTLDLTAAAAPPPPAPAPVNEAVRGEPAPPLPPAPVEPPVTTVVDVPAAASSSGEEGAASPSPWYDSEGNLSPLSLSATAVVLLLSAAAISFLQAEKPPGTAELETLVEVMQPLRANTRKLGTDAAIQKLLDTAEKATNSVVDAETFEKAIGPVVDAVEATLEAIEVQVSAVDEATVQAAKVAQAAADVVEKNAELVVAAAQSTDRAGAVAGRMADVTAAVELATQAVGDEVEIVETATQEATKVARGAVKAIEKTARLAQDAARDAEVDPQAMKELVASVTSVVVDAADALRAQMEVVDLAAQEAARVAEDAAKTVAENAAAVTEASKASQREERAMVAATSAVSKAADAIGVQAQVAGTAAEETSKLAAAVATTIKQNVDLAATDPAALQEAVESVSGTVADAVEEIESKVQAVEAAAQQANKATEKAANAVQRNAERVAVASKALGGGPGVSQSMQSVSDAVNDAAQAVGDEVEAVGAAAQDAINAARAAADSITKKMELAAEATRDGSVGALQEAMRSVSDAVTEAVEAVESQVRMVDLAAQKASQVAQTAADSLEESSARVSATSKQVLNIGEVDEAMTVVRSSVSEAADTIKSQVQVVNTALQQLGKVAWATGWVLLSVAQLLQTAVTNLDPEVLKTVLQVLGYVMGIIIEALKVLEKVVVAEMPRVIAATNTALAFYREQVRNVYAALPPDVQQQVISADVLAASPLLAYVGTNAVRAGWKRLLYGEGEWDVRPDQLRAMLLESDTLLVDIRSPKEALEGVPDLRRSARGKALLLSPLPLPPLVRAKASDPDKLMYELHAQTVSSMWSVRFRRAVVVMDRDGTKGQSFARLLRRKGIGQAYYLRGGFNRWKAAGLLVRPTYDVGFTDYVQQEAEALVSDALGLLGFSRPPRPTPEATAAKGSSLRIDPPPRPPTQGSWGPPKEGTLGRRTSPPPRSPTLGRKAEPASPRGSARVTSRR